MPLLFKLLMIVSLFAITGCSQFYDKNIEWEYVEPDSYPLLRATGYAPVNAQPAADKTTKVLQAMRASKLDAYRELAEQVYGQKIDGNTSIQQMVTQNSQLNASISGVIRGARVIRSYPVNDDLYATELALDMKAVHQVYLSVAKPRRIKNVTYY